MRKQKLMVRIGLKRRKNMKKNIYKWMVLVLVLGIGTAAVNNDKLFEISKNIEIFVKVYKELNKGYVDDLDPSELMRTGLDAMVGSLDPYTNYISESQVESYRLSDEGTYKGIGAEIDMVDGMITVIEPFDGSPAREAGLRAGDQITAINGLSTEGRNVEDFDRVVRGVPGTALNLTIKRAISGEVEDVSLIRSSVMQDNVPYHGMVKDGVGYVILTTFTPDASKNIAEAIKDIKKDNPDLTGIILDLRSNGGGLLREAIDVSNLFIPIGQEVVTTKGKVEDRDQSYRTSKPPLDLDIPLAVLINKTSASASEIVSGVIQDYDRGVLIGQRSYGKGLVQNTVNIAYNNRIKLTISKYYIPSRRCIQSVEYKDGEPVEIADELRSKFKTKNGRIVLDGGGVAPDIKMPEPKDSPLIKALKDQHLIFKYVNNYIIGKDSIQDLDGYTFTEYEDFSAFVKNQNFDYKTDTERDLESLMEASKEDFTNVDLSNEIQNLKNKILAEKNNAMMKEQETVTREIEKEIISRYFAQSGRIKFSLLKDKEVLEAVSVLNDPSRYQKILGY